VNQQRVLVADGSQQTKGREVEVAQNQPQHVRRCLVPTQAGEEVHSPARRVALAPGNLCRK
jgi:hypothetical protein